jgi:tetratricopeptide (TPR) repeat protein
LTNGYELVDTNRSFAGMSGAPILDTRGYVVGINAAAENEIEVDGDGGIVEISLGWSLGVSIRTFAKFIDKTTISSAQLKIETSAPPNITNAQQKSIEEQLLKVRELSSSDREFAWFNYGNQLLRTAKLDEAMSNDKADANAAFDKAIQLDPNFYQAYYARGVILSYRKKYQASLADFERVTQL